MKKVFLPLLTITLLLSFSAQAQEAQDAVTLFMTYIPNVQFAPVYAALEKGYFADNNVDLTIEHGDEPVGLNLIAADQREFGLISGEQVIAARANGLPVVSVFEWFQQYPVGIAYPEGAGIETVADLAGHNVGIPGRFGASYSGLTALLEANDLTEADIALEEIGFNAPEVFCMGGVDATVVYINNEPIQINHQAAAGDGGDISGVDVFRVSDAVDMVSNGIVTNEQTIAEQPELVSAVVTAFAAGLADVVANPAEAYLLSTAYVDNLPLSPQLEAFLTDAASARSAALASAGVRLISSAEYRANLLTELQAQFDAADLTQFEVLLATIDLWEADRPGMADAASWEATQDVLVSMGFVTEPIDTTAAFTNDFVPQ